MYEFTYDGTSRILTMRQWGFWTTDHVKSYFAEMANKVDEFRNGGGVVGIIVDNRDFPVQSNEVIALMSELSGNEMARMVNRTAIITPRALSKMQVRRIVGHETVRIFDNADEANGWLTAAS